MSRRFRTASRLSLWSLVALLAMPVSSSLAQRDLKNIPDPDPEIERASFIVADGMEVNLFAGDPQMAKPIQMNFDARGRLWIASSEVYPHIKPGQPATDKILVLEDTDHDGSVDKSTVFAGGLLIPTGVLPDADGRGCYVANSTELIYLHDDDGDGKADSRRIVLSGFGTEDTHHLLHTLRWGPDGCIYMNQSIYIHSHVETPQGVKRLNGGGIWRFRPETLELEIVCKGFVNPWGHHFDRWGQSFATDGAYGEGINYVFPGSVFVTSPGATRIMSGLNPGSPKHCGLEIVGGGHLPDDWQGSMITNDFRAHRVCRFVVTEDSSGYASRQEVEVIKSSHVAFRPIDVKMGTDGAIYIADWYNPIIQHGEVDFRDERRDHVHGRVWRVTAKGRPTLRTAIAENATVDELLNLLKASEDWTRLNAKLLLKQHGAEAVLPRLAAWLVSLDAADPNYEHQRLEALWLYECLDSPNAELLAELVKSADHRVRAAAIRTASHWRTRMKSPVVIEYFAAAVRDEHPRVRLEGVRALAEVPSAESAAQALVALDQPMDRFLDFALWQTMRDLQANWLPAVREGRLNFDGDVDRLTFALKAVDAPGVVPPLLALIRESKVTADRVPGILSVIAALGGANELGEVLNMVVDTGNQLSPEVKASLLDALVETTRLRQVTPAGDLARIGQLLKHDDERVQAAAARAAGAWKVESLRAAVSELAQASDATANVRRAALDGIAAFGGPESVKSLLAVANSQAEFSERQHAVNNLANIAPQAAAKRAVAMLRELPEGADPSPLLANLMARKDGPAALVKSFGESQDKLPADVAKLTVRAVQGSLRPSPELVEAVRAAGGLADAGWKLTPELSAQLVAEVAERGDAARGEAVFRSKSQQCLKCHAIGGAGGRVGPDLTSIGGSAQVDYLIESLIAPAAKVKENFHSKMVLDDNGRIFNGIPVRQAGGVLVLRDAEDREVSIPENQIDEIRDGRSLMPDGLVDPLTRDELVDLTRFLSELGKVGAYSISNTPVVRRWQVLTWTEEAHRRLNRTSFDTAATNDPALVWEPVYSRVFGDLPLDNLPTFQPHRQLPPTTFVRFELDVTTAGEVALQLGDVSGLSLWVDGKPQPITSELRLTLDQAVHSFTLAVDQNERRQPLRVELLPGGAGSAQFVTGK